MSVCVLLCVYVKLFQSPAHLTLSIAKLILRNLSPHWLQIVLQVHHVLAGPGMCSLVKQICAYAGYVYSGICLFMYVLMSACVTRLPFSIQ